MGVYPGPIDTDMQKMLIKYHQVSYAVLDALRTGMEDVFPDLMSNQLNEQWKVPMHRQ